MAVSRAWGTAFFVCVEIVYRIVCGCGDVYNKATSKARTHRHERRHTMKTYAYKTTGKIINGNYIDAPKQSGKPIDGPIGKRAAVVVDGKTYERTMYTRTIWHNMVTKRKDIARFVIINGINYEVTKA